MTEPRFTDMTQTKHHETFFAAAFLIGCFSVCWMSVIFIHGNLAALAITLVIGAVYITGSAELRQFRKATDTLVHALTETGKTDEALETWLSRLDSSLCHAVRMRIGGERIGLPAPVLTPYFVGLLVMLGLLGTFVGMIGTLKGAVIALEGTTELEAIRAGLAAPIKGLGLAFGTSIAGVTTSAMLGLMSALSRRDRMIATRHLDTRAAIVFKKHSLAHSQRETFAALQVQTRALPEVVQRLQAMTDRMEQVGDTLVRHQDRFHASVAGIFSDLAASMDKTHKESLAENVRLAGETIQPIVSAAMTGIAEGTRNVHQQLVKAGSDHLRATNSRFSDLSTGLTQAFKDALADQHQSNDRFIRQMAATLQAFQVQFEQMAESRNDAIAEMTGSVMEHLKRNDETRLKNWTASLENLQTTATTNLSGMSQKFSGELQQMMRMHQAQFDAARNDMTALSGTLTTQWQQAEAKSLERQNSISTALADTLKGLTGDISRMAEAFREKTSRLLTSTETLVRQRTDSEAAWMETFRERMEAVAQTVASELLILRKDEEKRGQAAFDRLSNLESAFGEHLTALGKTIEVPMTRLMQTAEGAPKAALDVISQLRKEATEKARQDADQMEKQERILKEIESLSAGLSQSLTDQHTAITRLTHQSKNMLEEAATRFKEHLGAEAARFSEISEHFTVGAVEMASLGEAFHKAVMLFNDSNENMIHHLSRIEETMETAASRSDEQLAYYVAQAREMIDYCMLSQKEIFEDLQALHQNTKMTMAG